MLTKCRIKFYEVDHNTDTCEGRGRQEVVWSGVGIKNAQKALERAEGVFGTESGKNIYEKTMTLESDGTITFTRRMVYGYHQISSYTWGIGWCDFDPLAEKFRS